MIEMYLRPIARMQLRGFLSTQYGFDGTAAIAAARFLRRAAARFLFGTQTNVYCRMNSRDY